MRRLRGQSGRPVKRLSQSSLTPMVDVFTLLLVALLTSYSTDNPVRPSDRGFALPRSTSPESPPQGVAVDLSEKGIFLEGQPLASSQYYLDQEDSLIQEIYFPLLKIDKGPLLIRSDEDIAYKLIQKVIFTAHEAGWTEISLVAQSKTSL